MNKHTPDLMAYVQGYQDRIIEGIYRPEQYGEPKRRDYERGWNKADAKAEGGQE